MSYGCFKFLAEEFNSEFHNMGKIVKEALRESALKGHIDNIYSRKCVLTIDNSELWQYITDYREIPTRLIRFIFVESGINGAKNIHMFEGKLVDYEGTVDDTTIVKLSRVKRVIIENLGE
jgi:hypothetical protein